MIGRWIVLLVVGAAVVAAWMNGVGVRRRRKERRDCHFDYQRLGWQ